ncbi:hypothetical protein MM300_21365 [Evansella sp. LMS18]|uniref:hypothetical protein n=1 Tax=Evansella sp. LMS18 TaxID=2924033 RepID=UPI0020D0B43D|nr:hypothetical protein [Evansella sp. LMS18]UTR10387.1 hypothetical protein MM300_21365 [Evansella sp. LMS18]
MKLITIIIACFILLTACGSAAEEGKKLPEEMPEDFNFQLKYGFEARDILDTYEDTFTHNMIEKEDITIDFQLSDEEMEEIYSMMAEADILNSAENASEYTCADPYEVNKLQVTFDGEVHEREWITSYCEKKPDKKLEEFIFVMHTEIVMPREEYRELPEPEGGYD